MARGRADTIRHGLAQRAGSTDLETLAEAFVKETRVALN